MLNFEEGLSYDATTSHKHVSNLLLRIQSSAVRESLECTITAKPLNTLGNGLLSFDAYSEVLGYPHFGGPCCLHLQGEI